jgi:hypothetical protein
MSIPFREYAMLHQQPRQHSVLVFEGISYPFSVLIFLIWGSKGNIHVQLGRKISEGAIAEKWLIAGDDAFVCKGNVITPYVRKELSRAQRNYNYFLSVNRQAVERTFALWKWKWGIFWRPLLIKENQIKTVIECTCRLHNLCIDVKQGGTLEDYIHHDDVFWQRLNSSSRRRTSQHSHDIYSVDFDPTFADAETISAITGITAESSTRTVRQRILRHVIETGRQMPDVGLLLDPHRLKKRQRGIRAGPQEPIRVSQIGNVGSVLCSE